MIPNGAAYDNFPPFANSGTRSAPAEAKYAQGMVPADTFPAEWANYFFHGATAGITRLNADTGSIKKEINNVLGNFNITPDGTLTDQLMTALNKLKAEAALAAHPVGSLYWTSSSENPAVTFGGGTWTQIKDRFIWAKGDSDTVNATGGAKTVTLAVANLPSHTHSFTPQGTISVTTNPTFTGSAVTSGGMSANETHTHSYNMSRAYDADAKDGYADFGRGQNYSLKRSGQIYSASVAHTHSVTAKGSISGGAYSFTGTAGTTESSGNGTAVDKMPPYIVKFCWERVS